MSVNRGKDFEKVFRECTERVPNVAVLRLNDQMNGFYGSKNPCDFVLYNKPYIYFIECKSVHGNRLPFTNISDYQWQEMTKVAKVDGVVAGVICWYIDRDVTLFIPIETLNALKCNGAKSVSYEIEGDDKFLTFTIQGKKKRIFFDYDMSLFFHDIEKHKRKS